VIDLVENIKELIKREEDRQLQSISLIASENICSNEVRMAQGSRLTDKYAEGYPGRRYYNGCEVVDEIERMAIQAACDLFGTRFANVQPHSGSQANQAIYNGFLSPGDNIIGMDLHHGGHLTHGSKVSSSGKWYNAKHYGTNKDGLIDLNEVEDLAKLHKPKLIIAGASSYTRQIDWAGFRSIADKVGAYFLADIAHFAGLIAGGQYESPVGFADFITCTTHKVLRGPRGGLILTDNPDYAKLIDSSVFPGIQGGPMVHTIAAKAICFAEAKTQEYKDYSKMVVLNAKALCSELQNKGWTIVSGGTDCHMFSLSLLDNAPNLSGREGANLLTAKGIIVNKEALPNDPRSVREASGIRFGTASATSRGMGQEEMKLLSIIIDSALLSKEVDSNLVDKLCAKFPLR
jgi:glycine hydroxymethyltransferase